MSTGIDIDRRLITEFAARWKITELSFFGSVLRDDFGPQSDVDVLVSFASDAEWSLWDHFQMEQELRQILGRNVDLVTRRALEGSPNWIRRKAILENAETVYAQR